MNARLSTTFMAFKTLLHLRPNTRHNAWAKRLWQPCLVPLAVDGCAFCSLRSAVVLQAAAAAAAAAAAWGGRGGAFSSSLPSSLPSFSVCFPRGGGCVCVLVVVVVNHFGWGCTVNLSELKNLPTTCGWGRWSELRQSCSWWRRRLWFLGKVIGDFLVGGVTYRPDSQEVCQEGGRKKHSLGVGLLCLKKKEREVRMWGGHLADRD